MIAELQKLFQFKTLQSKIFLSFLMFLIVPCCLMAYWLGKSMERIIRVKINESIQNTLTLTATNVEAVMEEMMAAVTVISMNDNLIKVLKTPERFNQYERIRITDQVMNIVYGTYLHELENFVTIMDFKGNIYSSWARITPSYNQMTTMTWYRQLLNSDGKFFWRVQQPNYINGKSGPLFTVAKLINENTLSSEYNGLVMVSIFAADMLKLLHKADTFPSTRTLLISDDGTILTGAAGSIRYTHFQKEPEFQQIFLRKQGYIPLKDGAKRVILNFGTLKLNGWKLVQLIPEQVVFKEIERIQRLNLVIMTGVLTLFAVITILISYRLTRPMKRLGQKMHEFSDESLELLPPERSFAEVNALVATYNKMIVKIKDLLLKVELEHQQQEMMRFRALQAQINPHFILNTLNNIKWLAYLSRAGEVGAMISSLGAIMEASLGRDEDIITLAREIDYVQNYIQLQKIRYNEKFEVSYEIPGELTEAEVVKFILQPLVENCISHGFKEISYKGKIIICAKQVGNDLAIAVADNGQGIAQAELERLRRYMEDTIDPKVSGRIGLKNIHERIRLTYGATYGLTIESEKGKGVTVVVLLPLRRLSEPKGVSND